MPAESTFCANCGFEIAGVNVAAVNSVSPEFCSKCGARSAEASYCTSCGAMLTVYAVGGNR
jgi:ribosomal protein L37E